jgi:hypothetical protein
MDMGSGGAPWLVLAEIALLWLATLPHLGAFATTLAMSVMFAAA